MAVRFSALLLLAILGAEISIEASGATSATFLEATKQSTLESLAKIEAIPAAVTNDFIASGRVSDITFASLSEVQSNSVKSVISLATAAKTGAIAGTGIFGLFSGAIIVVVLIVALVGLIIGLLLLLRKKVWKCSQCGFIFDRARL